MDHNFSTWIFMMAAAPQLLSYLTNAGEPAAVSWDIMTLSEESGDYSRSPTNHHVGYNAKDASGADVNSSMDDFYLDTPVFLSPNEKNEWEVRSKKLAQSSAFAEVLERAQITNPLLENTSIVRDTTRKLKKKEEHYVYSKASKLLFPASIVLGIFLLRSILMKFKEDPKHLTRMADFSPKEASLEELRSSIYTAKERVSRLLINVSSESEVYAMRVGQWRRMVSDAAAAHDSHLKDARIRVQEYVGLLNQRTPGLCRDLSSALRHVESLVNKIEGDVTLMLSSLEPTDMSQLLMLERISPRFADTYEMLKRVEIQVLPKIKLFTTPESPSTEQMAPAVNKMYDFVRDLKALYGDIVFRWNPSLNAELRKIDQKYEEIRRAQEELINMQLRERELQLLLEGGVDNLFA